MPLNDIDGRIFSITDRRATMNLRSRQPDASAMAIEVLVIRDVETTFSHRRVSTKIQAHIKSVNLGDLHFVLSGKIDLLIGVEVYAKIVSQEVRHVLSDSPVAQGTALRWLNRDSTNAVCDVDGPDVCAASITHLETVCDALNRFWGLEEVIRRREPSLADQECEYLFTAEHRRNKEGRYIVSLLVKHSVSVQSRATLQAARHYLRSAWAKIMRDARFAKEYQAFMTE